MTELWGTIVNVAAILLGGCVGLLVHRGIPKRLSDALMCAVGFCTMYIGITGALDGTNTLVVVLSLVIGALVGELLSLEDRLNKLGKKIENRFVKEGKTSSLAKGFVSASLLYCVGTMAIVGSLQSGLANNHQMLYMKAVLDGISSVIFVASFGWGAMLAVFPVFLYQGSITMLAQLVAPVLSESVIAQMNCVGSLLIIGLSLNLLQVAKIKVVNFVPAILVPIGLCPLYESLFIK